MPHFDFALVLLATFSLASALGAEKDSRPNLLFFFPDTLRAESFNSYGNTVPNVTPNFDRFAKSGTRFEQAHVMHTQCSPSRATMMTGRYMHVLGHRTQIHLIRAYEENYWRLLKESGYHVQWYGKNDALSATAFNLSVSAWEQDIGYDSGSNAFKFNESGYWSMLFTGGTSEGNDTAHSGDLRAVKKAVEFMQNSPPEPFAIFLPTRGAHPPYGTPQGFQNLWSEDEVKNHVKLRPWNLSNKPKYHSEKIGIRHYRNLTGLSEDTMYKIQKSYLEMIHYTDYTFGVLLDGLESSDVLDRTAVFVSSDHGDFAGDFGLVEKWPGGADDVLTRVPMAIRVPGGKRGVVSEAPVQTADIMETMLQLASVKNDFVRFAESLLPTVLHGEDGDHSRFVYSEGGFLFHSELFPGGSDHVPNNPQGLYWPRAQEEMSDDGKGSPKWVMVRNLTAKLVYRPEGYGISELYDLVKDPRELQNVIYEDRYATLRQELKEHLMGWLLKTGDVPPLRNDPRSCPKFPSPITQSTCSNLLQPDPSHDESGYRNADFLKINGIPNHEIKHGDKAFV
eukprot:g4353.t1